MTTTWIVRWHDTEEEFTSFEDAVERWEYLDARGIEAEVFELVDGQRRRLLP
jgi:hypothetical protein